MQAFLDNFQKIAAGMDDAVYTKLDDLSIGKVYCVEEFAFKTTKYGKGVTAILEDAGKAIKLLIFLPSRLALTITTDEELQLLNAENYHLIFRGRDAAKKNMARIDFIKNLNSQKHMI